MRPEGVLKRRELLRRLASAGQRLGYAAFAAAVAIFFSGMVAGFSPAIASATVTALVVGSVLLAPAIVLGYAVRAAEKEDPHGSGGRTER